MKKKIIFSLFFLFLVCLLFKLILSFLPQFIATQISHQLEQKVFIEKIQFSPPRQIFLHRISIGEKKWITLRKMIVNYSLRKLFREKNFLHSIYRLDLIGLEIVWEEKNKLPFLEKFDFLKAEKDKDDLIPQKQKLNLVISISEGKIIFKSSEKNFEAKIQQLKGAIDLGRDKLYLLGQTDFSKVNNLELKGHLGLFDEKFNLTLKIKKLFFPPYLSYFSLPNLIVKEGFISGEVSFYKQANRIIPVGKINFAKIGGEIKKPFSQKFKDLEATLSVKNKEIFLHSASGYLGENFFRGEGRYKEENLSLRLSCPQFNLAEIRDFVPFHFSGQVALKIFLSGPLAKIKIQTELSSPQIQVMEKVSFKNLKACLSFSTPQFIVHHFSARLFRGKVEAKGTVSPSQLDFSLNLSRLQFKRNKFNLKGILRGSFKNPVLTINSDFYLPQDKKEEKPITISLHYQNSSLRLEGKNPYLAYFFSGLIEDLEWGKEESSFQGRIFLLKEKVKRGEIYLTGFFTRTPPHLQLQLNSEKIKVGETEFTQLRTEFNFSSPQIVLSHSQKFPRLSTQEKISFRFTVDLRKKQVLLENLEVSQATGKIRGQGQFRWPDKKINLRFFSKNYQLGPEYFLSGEANLKGRIRRKKITGKLVFGNTSLNQTPFKPVKIEFSYSPQFFEVKKFSYGANLQGRGKVFFLPSPRLEFEVGLKKVDLLPFFSLFRLSPEKQKLFLTGRLRLAGSPRHPYFSGYLSLENKGKNSFYQWVNLNFHGCKNLLFFDQIALCRGADAVRFQGKIERLVDSIKLNLNFHTPRYKIGTLNFSAQGLIKGNFIDQHNYEVKILTRQLQFENKETRLKIEAMKLDLRNLSSQLEFFTRAQKFAVRVKDIHTQGKTFFIKMKKKEKNKGVKGIFWVRQLKINDEKIKSLASQFVYSPYFCRFSPLKGVSGGRVKGEVRLIREKHRFKGLAFKKFQISGREMLLEAAGQITPSSTQFFLEGKNLPADLIPAWFLSQRKILSGQLDFTLHFSGRLANPFLKTTFQIKKGEVLRIKFDTFQGTVKLKDQLVQVEKTKITRRDSYELKINGTIPLDSEKKEIDLVVKVPTNSLALLSSISDGKVKATSSPPRDDKEEVILHLKGTFDDPSLYGHVSIEQGKIILPHLIKPLRQLTIDLVLEKNKIYINKLEGYVEKGFFRVVKYQEGPNLVIKENKIEKINLALVTDIKRGLKVSIPGYMKKRHWGNVVLRGLAQKEPFIITEKGIRGKLIFSRGRFTYPPADTSTPGGGDVLSQLDLDLQFQAGPGLWYEIQWAGGRLDCEIKGKIKLVKEEKKVIVTGQAEVKKGTLRYLDTIFKIKKGKIKFPHGEKTLEPIISLYAETRLRNVIRRNEQGEEIERFNCLISLSVEECKISEIDKYLVIESYPPLDPDPVKNKEKITALLTLGEMEARISPSQLSTAFGMMAKEILRRPVSQAEEKIKSFLNIDLIQLRPGFIESLLHRTFYPTSPSFSFHEDERKNLEIILGKYVGSWYLGYRVDVPVEIYQEERVPRVKKRRTYHHQLEVEYELTPQTLVKGEWFPHWGREEKDEYRIGIQYRETF
jgi:hypothetical protein